MALILASQSPRRRELLQWIRRDFIVRPPQFEESAVTEANPQALAERLAAGKAHAVLAEPGDTVIGCDTVVVFRGEVFGKPAGRADARRMLLALSGQTHEVLSGVCVRSPAGERVFSCCTQVTFYPLSPEEVEAYLDTGEPFDKAGAYGIQGYGALLVKGIAGDYSNVVGLPIAPLSRVLRELGV